MMKEENKRERILAAARALFVEHGYAGTSMGNIAKQAGVNHSLIFHYFDNKETLWGAVKLVIVEEAQQQGAILPENSLPFDQFMLAAVRNSIRFYADNRDIARMIHWLRLQQSDEKQMGVTRSASTQAWLAAIRHYQNSGDIEPTFKPEYVLTLLLSATNSFASDLNGLIEGDAEREAWICFCAERLTVALTARVPCPS